MSSDDDRDNRLARELSKLDLDLPEGTEPSEGSEEQPAQSADVPERQLGGEGDREESLSDDELFRRAVETMDPSRIYDAKYRGESGASLPQKRDRREGVTDEGSVDRSDTTEGQEEQARRELEVLRDEALFKNMVGSVTPLEDRDKYHQARPRRPKEIGDESKEGGDKLVTPRLPRKGKGLNHLPPLDSAQSALLERYRRAHPDQSPAELHLRGQKKIEARQALMEFMEEHHQRGASFVRIIHGRGLRSEIDPVLKPTVLAWLEGPGLELIRGYAPERTRSGDYGSLIVELRRG